MFKALLFLLLTTSYAMAGGDRVGNGGDVVVCGNKVELLDVYEARVSNHVIYKPVGKDYKQMFQDIIQKHLSNIQPVRSARYLNHQSTFESEAQFLPGIELNDVDDAGMVAIPKGCKLKQIVIQLSDDERPAGKPRYTVSLDLWKRLDEFNKAALVLHEIFYREAIEHESSNSMVVRAMVGEVLSTKLNLDIYLALDADFSNTIEFKMHTWNILEKKRPNIQLGKNEFQEDIISFKGHFSSDTSSLDIYQIIIRLDDGKTLEAGDYIKFVRANTKTDFFGSQIVIADRDLDFENGQFKGTKDFNLKVTFISSHLEANFEHVNKLFWLFYSEEGSNVFNGEFSLTYKNKNWNFSGPISSINLSPLGDVLSFSQSINPVAIKVAGGVLNCHSYSSFFSNDVFSLGGCEPESSISLNIRGISLIGELANTTDIYISKDEKEILIQEPLTILLSNRTLIGLDYNTSADVYLETGKYTITTYKRAQGFPYTIQGEKADYDINFDGRVAVDPHR